MKSLQNIVLLLTFFTTGASAQELTISAARVRSGTLEIEITLKNGTSGDLFVIAPSRKLSEPNHSFRLDEKRKKLHLQRAMFRFPDALLAVVSDLDEPCYQLTKIGTGERYKETLTLPYPVAINIFPIDHRVDIGEYDLVDVGIGLLPADDVIRQIAQNRPFGHCVMSDDEISTGPYKGKSLIELQSIVIAGPASIQKKPDADNR